MNKTTAIAAIIVIVVLGLMWGGRGTKKDNRPSPAASPLLTKAALPDEGDMIVLNAADYEKIEGPVKVLDDPSCAGGKCLFVPDKVLGKPVKFTDPKGLRIDFNRGDLERYLERVIRVDERVLSYYDAVAKRGKRR